MAVVGVLLFKLRCHSASYLVCKATKTNGRKETAHRISSDRHLLLDAYFERRVSRTLHVGLHLLCVQWRIYVVRELICVTLRKLAHHEEGRHRRCFCVGPTPAGDPARVQCREERIDVYWTKRFTGDLQKWIEMHVRLLRTK